MPLQTTSAGLLAECEVSTIGVVFVDVDEDGEQDLWEQGQADVQVNLYDDADQDHVFAGGDALTASTLTDADGAYRFQVQPDTSYFIEVVLGQGRRPTNAMFRQIISHPCDPHINTPLEFGFIAEPLSKTLWFPCVMAF